MCQGKPAATYCHQSTVEHVFTMSPLECVLFFFWCCVSVEGKQFCINLVLSTAVLTAWAAGSLLQHTALAALPTLPQRSINKRGRDTARVMDSFKFLRQVDRLLLGGFHSTPKLPGPHERESSLGVGFEMLLEQPGNTWHLSWVRRNLWAITERLGTGRLWDLPGFPPGQRELDPGLWNHSFCLANSVYTVASKNCFVTGLMLFN